MWATRVLSGMLRPLSCSNFRSTGLRGTRTWEAREPDFGPSIAALLERCAELLGVDLATVWQVAANVDPISGRTAPRSGASCSWSGDYARRRSPPCERIGPCARVPHRAFRHTATPQASRRGDALMRNVPRGVVRQSVNEPR